MSHYPQFPDWGATAVWIWQATQSTQTFEWQYKNNREKLIGWGWDRHPGVTFVLRSQATWAIIGDIGCKSGSSQMKGNLESPSQRSYVTLDCGINTGLVTYCTPQGEGQGPRQARVGVPDSEDVWDWAQNVTHHNTVTVTGKETVKTNQGITRCIWGLNPVSQPLSLPMLTISSSVKHQVIVYSSCRTNAICQPRFSSLFRPPLQQWLYVHYM